MSDINLLFSLFLKEKSTYCADKTMIYYRDNIRSFINFLNDRDITTDIIQEYIIDLRASGIKNTSINTYARAIKVFIIWLKNNNYMILDLKDIKLPRNNPKIIKPLTENEVLLIDNNTWYRDKAICHLMLDAGLRSSEVCALRRKDIDIDNKVIYINDSKFNKSRAVPIVPELMQLLDNILYNKTKNDFIILQDNNKPITTDIIKHLFYRLKSRTGIIRLHAHLLRHTFATSYILGGGNLETLRLILGHSGYDVTRNYLHLANQSGILNYPIYKLDKSLFKTGY